MSGSVAIPLSERRFNVSSPLLLSLYGVIPVCFLVALIDIFILQGNLRDNVLPRQPASLILWAIIFNFPHIVSSLITLADDEYIPFYKETFSKALKIIVVSVLTVNVVFPLVLPTDLAKNSHFLFFAFFASFTMYHVLSQQFGIGMMMMKARPGKDYEIWRWLSTIAATFMYAMVFLKDMIIQAPVIYLAGQILAGVFMVLGVLQGFKLTLSSQRKLGSYYVYSNLMLLFSTYCFMLLDYDIFVILIPRFVHDLTAFIIYSTHDHNRNLDKKHNYIYKALSFLKIPPIILCSLLAILVANSVECGTFFVDLLLGFDPALASECVFEHVYSQDKDSHNGMPDYMQIWYQIMFICGFFHYYIESFVWKRDAIHRHSVKFT